MLELFKRIRSRREELGISQDELAKMVGYKSRSSINKIELGKNDITQSKIMEIATALATTPEYLMGWTSEVSKHFNEDEVEIVDGYRSLPEESKKLVKGMIFQLNKTASADIENRSVMQKGLQNNGANGANIVDVGSSHFRQNVSVR